MCFYYTIVDYKYLNWTSWLNPKIHHCHMIWFLRILQICFWVWMLCENENCPPSKSCHKSRTFITKGSYKPTSIIHFSCGVGVITILILSGNAANAATFKSADYPHGFSHLLNAFSSVVIWLSCNTQCIFSRWQNTLFTLF